jgi:hypothetical protein
MSSDTLFAQHTLMTIGPFLLVHSVIRSDTPGRGLSLNDPNSRIDHRLAAIVRFVHIPYRVPDQNARPRSAELILVSLG